jgi:hypothetical protein
VAIALVCVVTFEVLRYARPQEIRRSGEDLLVLQNGGRGRRRNGEETMAETEKNAIAKRTR